MEIQINGRKANMPTSLTEFTLGEKIDFQLQYGNDLDKMLQSILAMPEGPLKELEVLHYGYEKMFRTVAFFLKVDPASLSESNYIDEIARIYYSSAAVLLEQEKEITLEKEIIWNDEIWVISAPELAQGSPMTFGEFIDAKQMVSQMVKLGHSQWEYMLPLCAIYLRKKGEAYTKEFLYEGSDRQQLMRSLPMSIALQVGFFLTGTLNISINILKFSGNLESNLQALRQGSTTSSTVG